MNIMRGSYSQERDQQIRVGTDFVRGVGVWALLVMLLSAAFVGAALAASNPDEGKGKGERLKRINNALAVAGGRYNELHRLNAERAYLKGDRRLAAEQYRLAAGYADKFSQHRLSLMYWRGDGVPKDRVQAYIWSDLAAERGTPSLLANRERMWHGLSAAEREQVAAIGPDYYAEYGDAVAKPRQQARMLAESRNHTGTRTGYDGFKLEMSKVQGVLFGQGPGTPDDLAIPVSAESLYGADRSDPETYWRIQDAILAGGTVEVGDLQSEAGERARKNTMKPRRKQAERLM